MSFHIGAKAGEIADKILLPGDPMREKYSAQKFFDTPVCFNEVRGMYGYTGTYKGVKVSAMGTGMGMPQVGIYATELMRDYGVNTLIRVGTCGGLKKEMQLQDIILGQGACCDTGMINAIFPGTYAPIADFDLLYTAYKKAQERGLDVWTGPIKSSDLLYSEKNELAKNWAAYGVLAVEMEAAILYTLAAKYQRRALTVLSVSDGGGSTRDLTFEEKEQGLDKMITLALDTAIEF